MTQHTHNRRHPPQHLRRATWLSTLAGMAIGVVAAVLSMYGPTAVVLVIPGSLALAWATARGTAWLIHHGWA